MAAMGSKTSISQEEPSKDETCCIAIHCQLTIKTWKSCFSLVIYLHMSSQISSVGHPILTLVALGRFLADHRHAAHKSCLACACTQFSRDTSELFIRVEEIFGLDIVTASNHTDCMQIACFGFTKVDIIGFKHGFFNEVSKIGLSLQ